MKRRRTPMRERACTIFGNRLLKWMETETNSKEEGHIFYLEFCLQEGLDRHALDQLRREYPGFDAMIRFAEELQEIKLNQLALAHGKFSGASFLLKCHHGYGEKNETETKHSPEQSTLDPHFLETASDEELLDLIHSLTQDNH